MRRDRAALRNGRRAVGACGVWWPSLLTSRREPTRRIRSKQLISAALLATAAVSVVALRRRMLRWGATDTELELPLAGDELLPAVDLTSTRSITINAPAETVWPWLAQLGQGRGGFYSYDFLENLFGMHMHSADRVHRQWQDLPVGSSVHLAPQVRLTVAISEPARALVLRGGVPVGAAPAPYDFTWAFTLHPGPAATTRLVVRERYRYSRRWAALVVEPAEWISALMSPRMLNGIKQRAEQRPAHEADPGGAQPVERGVPA